MNVLIDKKSIKGWGVAWYVIKSTFCVDKFIVIIFQCPRADWNRRARGRARRRAGTGPRAEAWRALIKAASVRRSHFTFPENYYTMARFVNFTLFTCGSAFCRERFVVSSLLLLHALFTREREGEITTELLAVCLCFFGHLVIG